MPENTEQQEINNQNQSVDDLLNKLLKNQIRQQKQLQDMHEKIGCLYMYMIFSLVVGVISLIAYLF